MGLEPMMISDWKSDAVATEPHSHGIVSCLEQVHVQAELSNLAQDLIGRSRLAYFTLQSNYFDLERLTRIELVPLEWQSRILPLNHNRLIDD